MIVNVDVSKLEVPTAPSSPREMMSAGWSAEKWALPYASSYLLVFRARNATLKIGLINPFGKHAATVFGRIILLSAFAFPVHIAVSEVKKKK